MTVAATVITAINPAHPNISLKFSRTASRLTPIANPLSAKFDTLRPLLKLMANGMLGATVMPHVIYLHSALTKSRVQCRDDAQGRACGGAQDRGRRAGAAEQGRHRVSGGLAGRAFAGDELLVGFNLVPGQGIAVAAQAGARGGDGGRVADVGDAPVAEVEAVLRGERPVARVGWAPGLGGRRGLQQGGPAPIRLQ